MPTKKKPKAKRKSPSRAKKTVPKISPKKLETYTNKLYRGELARYKKKLAEENSFTVSMFFKEENRKRNFPTVSQVKTVLSKHKNKCVVCSKPYDKDEFDIHHINGDRTYTVMSNLVPMCTRCHRKISRLARAKLQDYINKKKHSSSSNPYTDIYKPIEFKPPKFKI